MSVEIRSLRSSDLPDFVRCFSVALGMEAAPDWVSRLDTLLDPDGTFLALDKGRVVGTLGAYGFDLSAPGGGTVAAVGTTTAGVLPTHRRRGLLSRLLAAQLDWARGRGAVVAGLWASEASIYGRFGFGVATQQGEWTVDARRAGLLPLFDEDELRLELVGLDEARARVMAVYDAVWRDRACALSRTADWWDIRRLDDHPTRRGGAGELLFVVAVNGAGKDVGYLQYRRTSHWERGLSEGVLRIEELLGTPEARRALFRFALSVDLVEQVHAVNLPVDDVLPWILIDRRRARVLSVDAVWLKPLDPVQFLEARSYPPEIGGRVVVGVLDDGQPELHLELSVSSGRGEVVLTESVPDVRLTRSALASVGWGGVSPRILAEAGLLEGSPEAIGRLSRFLATDCLPWCPERF